MRSKDKRTVHVSFKASEAEAARIREKMKAVGISNQSAYCVLSRRENGAEVVELLDQEVFGDD